MTITSISPVLVTASLCSDAAYAAFSAVSGVEAVMGALVPRTALDTLRDRIAGSVKENAKSYDVPAVCTRVGI